MIRAINCLAFVLHLCAGTSAAFDKQTNEKNILEWIVSKGGYWNPGLELRYDEAIPDLYGVFARDNISKHDILASIPWECVIYINNENEDHPDRFDEECHMVKRLSDELEVHMQQKKSRYSHYIEGLVQTAEEHSKLLPVYWSQAGKDLLSRIIYDEDQKQQVLPPEDLFLDQDEWRRNCETKINPMATLLVMTHGEDFGMVPLTDKFNSRGGNYTGAFFSMENGSGDIALEIRALRSLEKGEQVYTDYHDYGAIGAPELLRDYGFVETYPQRWIFHRQRVAFDVIEENTNRFEIEWLEEDRYIGNPVETNPHITDRIVKYFSSQLDRLEQKVYPLILEAATRNDAPSAYEIQTVRQFYTAFTNAIKLAVETIDTVAAPADEL